MKPRTPFIFLLSLYLSGCASYYRIPDQTSTPRFAQTDKIVLIADQKEITGEFVAPMTAYNGLLFALIAYDKAKKARKDLDKKMAVIPSDLPSYAWDYLRRTIENAAVESPSTVVFSRAKVTSTTMLTSNAKSYGGALILKPEFEITDSQSTLQLTVEAYFPYTPNPSSSNLDYRNRFVASAPCYMNLFLDDNTTDLPEKAVKALQNAIEEVSAEVAAMIFYDLQGAPNHIDPKNSQPDGLFTIIRQTESRIWKRAQNGSIISQPANN